MLAATPDPPYVAVVFSSVRVEADDGYAAVAARMEEMAARQPGFLGVESARGSDGLGVTVSYWRSREDAAAWKRVGEHVVAQRLGRERFYRAYVVRVAVVEREDAWQADGRDERSAGGGGTGR